MIFNDIFKIFESVTSPFHYIFKRKLAHHLFQKKIKSILMSVNDEKLRGWYQPCNLINSREFRGMVYSLLKPNGYHYSAKDIAVAINIATAHYCDNSFTKSSHEIIDFSYHILSEIKECIVSNKVIKDEMSDYGKDINLIDDKSDRGEIEFLFKNKKELFKHYFSTFNDMRYNHTIKIWHQGNDNTWINWSEHDSIDVNINPYKIREGFFLIGFDYYDVTRDERLHVASNEGGYEFFNKFIDRSSCVWMQ